MNSPVSPSAMQYQHLAESVQERARAYLNCDTDLDGLGVTNLVAAMHDEIARLRADRDDLCIRLEKSGGREMDLADKLEAMRAELSAERTRCAAIARQLNCPQVFGAIEGAK